MKNMPTERWRELCALIQHEQDPERLSEYIAALLDELKTKDESTESGGRKSKDTAA